MMAGAKYIAALGPLEKQETSMSTRAANGNALVVDLDEAEPHDVTGSTGPLASAQELSELLEMGWTLAGAMHITGQRFRYLFTR
jgi:hypothetical protein